MGATVLKFTERERTVLMHRLSLTECIAEAEIDRCPEDPPSPYTYAQVEAAALKLEEELLKNCTLTIETDIDLLVLEDLVDGNTFGVGLEDAMMDDELTLNEVAAWRRTIRRLNSKLARNAGITSTFPE